jgi:hypothetical protein
MLDGKRDPHFISYHCKRYLWYDLQELELTFKLHSTGEQGMNCGGLGDRFVMSFALERAYRMLTFLFVCTDSSG